LGRFKAREDLTNYLKDAGSLLEVTEYKGTIGICSRTQDVIEPTILPHWFFQTRDPTDTLMAAITNGQFIVRPENQQKNFLRKLADTQ
jgi:valyl-tRNA synthetase